MRLPVTARRRYATTTTTTATTTLLLTVFFTPLLAHGASSSSSPKKCYFPNGAENTGTVPCDPDADVSMCCGSGQQCLSSGLCAQNSTGPNRGVDFARGACTDRSWESEVCPWQCRINQDSATDPLAYDFGGNGVQVWECVGEGYEEPGAYCCESAAEKTRCCRTKTAVFSLPGATVGNALAVQTFPAPPDTTTGSASVTTTSGETSSPGDTKSTSGESSDRPSATSSSGIPAGIGGSGPPRTAVHTGPEGTETAIPGGSPGLSDAGKIGMGVGIGVGVTLLLATAIFAWLWMRARAAAAAAAKTEAAAAAPWPEWDTAYKKPELDGNGACKWGSRAHAPEELSGDHPPAELWSGSVSWIGSSGTR